MANLHSSGKDTDPKVPYQEERLGARVIRARQPSPASEFAERFIRENPLTFRALAEHDSGRPYKFDEERYEAGRE